MKGNILHKKWTWAIAQEFLSISLLFLTLFNLQEIKAQGLIELPIHGNKILRGPNILFFKDPSGRMTFEQVQTKKFAETNSDIPNFGYSSSAIWVKVNVNNIAGSGHWGIVVENPNLNEIELYVQGQKSSLPTSSSAHYKKKYINHYFPIPEGAQVFYLKVTSDELLFLPIKIAEANYLLDQWHRLDIWLGLYSGFMISVILFNLFIYFSLRDRTYLYYFCYNVSFTLFIWHTTGYLAHTFSTNINFIDKYSVLTPMTAIFGLLFIIRFLRLDASQPLNKTGKYLIYVFLFGFCCELLDLKLTANVIASLASLGGVVYIIIVCLQSIVARRYKPAKFLLIAWIILLLSAVVFNLTSFGIIPYTTFLYNSMQLGSAVETILISLALADRVAMIKKDIAEAEKREREHILKHNLFVLKQNASLQEAVEHRTKELEKANGIKDRFFSIVAHDLRNPLYSLSALLNLFQSEISNRFSREQIISISQKIGATVRNTIDLTENLLTWAKSQMEVEGLLSEEIELEEIVKFSINDMISLANAKKIQISNQVSSTAVVIADRRHLAFILRNLLSNAIKFTESGGQIIIKCLLSDGYRHIQILDNGIGMSKETLQNIFRIDVRKNTPGTNGEKGTGLGLPLCKEFAEKNKGTIYVKSEIGMGSVFVISLPDSEIKKIPFSKRKAPTIINEFDFSKR